jgi:hypothetical protein
MSLLRSACLQFVLHWWIELVAEGALNSYKYFCEVWYLFNFLSYKWSGVIRNNLIVFVYVI